MRYIALFFPAIISVGIEYRKNDGKCWGWFEYLCKYAGFLICNVLMTQSLVSYVFDLGTVTIDAFDSFPFFTKYLSIASAFAIILPHILRIIKANIYVSLEIHKDAGGSVDSKTEIMD